VELFGISLVLWISRSWNGCSSWARRISAFFSRYCHAWVLPLDLVVFGFAWLVWFEYFVFSDWWVYGRDILWYIFELLLAALWNVWRFYFERLTAPISLSTFCATDL
jgi:hypothetical protein